jgi:hypothetical protein
MNYGSTLFLGPCIIFLTTGPVNLSTFIFYLTSITGKEMSLLQIPLRELRLRGPEIPKSRSSDLNHSPCPPLGVTAAFVLCVHYFLTRIDVCVQAALAASRSMADQEIKMER